MSEATALGGDADEEELSSAVLLIVIPPIGAFERRVREPKWTMPTRETSSIQGDFGSHSPTDGDLELGNRPDEKEQLP
jgi:hypothetical protein